MSRSFVLLRKTLVLHYRMVNLEMAPNTDALLDSTVPYDLLADFLPLLQRLGQFPALRLWQEEHQYSRQNGAGAEQYQGKVDRGVLGEKDDRGENGADPGCNGADSHADSPAQKRSVFVKLY